MHNESWRVCILYLKNCFLRKLYHFFTEVSPDLGVRSKTLVFDTPAPCPILYCQNPLPKPM